MAINLREEKKQKCLDKKEEQGRNREEREREGGGERDRQIDREENVAINLKRGKEKKMPG